MNCYGMKNFKEVDTENDVSDKVFKFFTSNPLGKLLRQNTIHISIISGWDTIM